MITGHSAPSLKKATTAIYDFDRHGGAVSVIGLGVHLPPNVIVTRSWYDVIVAPTSAGAAKIAMGIADDDPTGILIATGFAAFTVAQHEGIQDDTVANFAEKTTANRELILTISDAALTAGKIVVFVEYAKSIQTPP